MWAVVCEVDSHEKKQGSKVHFAVDTWGRLLVLRVKSANYQERALVGSVEYLRGQKSLGFVVAFRHAIDFGLQSWSRR